jgi:hypothetical protein
MPAQCALVALSFALFMLCLYKPIMQFSPLDSSPQITPYTQAQINPAATPVRTGMRITDFLKFDAIKNEYVVNAIVWFVYNPQKISTEKVGLFSFTKGEIIKKSDPTITLVDNGLTMAQYHIRVQFSSIPNYARFPLDDHYVYLNLTNTSVDPRTVLFTADQADYSVSHNVYTPGWRMVEHTVRSGYATEQLTAHHTIQQPKISFSMGLSKQDYRQLLLIILPLLLIFYCGIFAFSIKDPSLAMTVILASIAGLIAYSFVIQTLSPVVGYLMLSDHLFLLFLGAIFSIFFIIMLDATPEHIVSKKTVQTIKGWAILAIYAVLILAWYYVTNIKYLA